MPKKTPTRVKSKKTGRKSMHRSSKRTFLESRLSKKQLIVFAVVFAIIGGYFTFRSFAGTTLLTTLEAETMALPPNNTSANIITDSSASGGKYLQFNNKVLATGSASLVDKPASNKLTVRAKGAQCQGAPHIEVRVNGAQAKTFSVGSSWTEYTYNPTIAAGTNPQITVEFMNPYTDTKGKSGKPRCSRDLSVDKIMLYEVTPDTIVANITVPVSGAIISGSVNVEAKPISSNGISKVEFFVDGTAGSGYRDGALTTEVSAPYCLAGDGGTTSCHGWDSRSVPNGSHTITAYAYDNSGVRSAPHTITISVNNTTVEPNPSGGINPSGQAMPVGDLPGWKQIFTDDFPTNVPLGSFPTAVADKWGAYPYPWRDTKGQRSSDPTLGGWYHPGKTVSIGNGMMDIWMHTETLDGAQKRLVAAPQPKIKGSGTSAGTGQLYGRYAVRFRVDPNRLVNNFSGYKVAWLLWPDSSVWPRDGEIDFPEGDLDDTIKGFLHKQEATSGSDQYYALSGKPFKPEWHTAVIEWGPGRGAFYIDGALMTNASGGKSEWFDRIPNTPMHWVLQSETELGDIVPAANTEGHIQIDWVAVWSKI